MKKPSNSKVIIIPKTPQNQNQEVAPEVAPDGLEMSEAEDATASSQAPKTEAPATKNN